MDIPSQRLFLIGYRCTGKSSVGRYIAHQLQWAFCDTDRLIEQSVDRKINTLFDQEGKETFRDLEQNTLETVCSLPESVIATGGGVVLREQNRNLLSTEGTVIWLRATSETIRKRMKQDPKTDENRPALTESDAIEEVESVLEERKELYDQSADYSISTEDHDPESIATFILDELRTDEE